MEVMEISRKVMENMDAFEGCKPVVHSTESVIIRGKGIALLMKSANQNLHPLRSFRDLIL